MADVWTSTTPYTITGIAASNLDSRFRLHFSQVADGGGEFHTELYSRERRETGDLVAHTAAYSGTGTPVALVEDNDSGIGGTVTLNTLAPCTTAYAEFAKWYVCADIDDSSITLWGPALNGGAGYILALAYGSPEKVALMSMQAPGSYAEDDTTTASADFAKTRPKWNGPNARIVGFDCFAEAVGSGDAGRPYVNVYTGYGETALPVVSTDNSGDGIEVGNDAWESRQTTDGMDVEGLAVGYGYLLETTIVQQSANADDQNLTVWVTLVLE